MDEEQAEVFFDQLCGADPGLRIRPASSPLTRPPNPRTLDTETNNSSARSPSQTTSGNGPNRKRGNAQSSATSGQLHKRTPSGDTKAFQEQGKGKGRSKLPRALRKRSVWECLDELLLSYISINTGSEHTEPSNRGKSASRSRVEHPLPRRVQSPYSAKSAASPSQSIKSRPSHAGLQQGWFLPPVDQVNASARVTLPLADLAALLLPSPSIREQNYLIDIAVLGPAVARIDTLVIEPLASQVPSTTPFDSCSAASRRNHQPDTATATSNKRQAISNRDTSTPQAEKRPSSSSSILSSPQRGAPPEFLWFTSSNGSPHRVPQPRHKEQSLQNDASSLALAKKKKKEKRKTSRPQSAKTRCNSDRPALVFDLYVQPKKDELATAPVSSAQPSQSQAVWSTTSAYEQAVVLVDRRTQVQPFIPTVAFFAAEVATNTYHPFLPEHTPAPCAACAYLCALFTDYERAPCYQNLTQDGITRVRAYRQHLIAQRLAAEAEARASSDSHHLDLLSAEALAGFNASDLLLEDAAAADNSDDNDEEGGTSNSDEDSTNRRSRDSSSSSRSQSPSPTRRSRKEKSSKVVSAFASTGFYTSKATSKLLQRKRTNPPSPLASPSLQRKTISRESPVSSPQLRRRQGIPKNSTDSDYASPHRGRRPNTAASPSRSTVSQHLPFQLRTPVVSVTTHSDGRKGSLSPRSSSRDQPSPVKATAEGRPPSQAGSPRLTRQRSPSIGPTSPRPESRSRSRSQPPPVNLALQSPASSPKGKPGATAAVGESKKSKKAEELFSFLPIDSDELFRLFPSSYKKTRADLAQLTEDDPYLAMSTRGNDFQLQQTRRRNTRGVVSPSKGTRKGGETKESGKGHGGKKGPLHFSFKQELTSDRGYVVGDMCVYNPRRHTLQEWASGKAQMERCRMQHGIDNLDSQPQSTQQQPHQHQLQGQAKVLVPGSTPSDSAFGTGQLLHGSSRAPETSIVSNRASVAIVGGQIPSSSLHTPAHSNGPSTRASPRLQRRLLQSTMTSTGNGNGNGNGNGDGLDATSGTGFSPSTRPGSSFAQSRPASAMGNFDADADTASRAAPAHSMGFGSNDSTHDAAFNSSQSQPQQRYHQPGRSTTSELSKRQLEHQKRYLKRVYEGGKSDPNVQKRVFTSAKSSTSKSSNGSTNSNTNIASGIMSSSSTNTATGNALAMARIAKPPPTAHDHAYGGKSPRGVRKGNAVRNGLAAVDEGGFLGDRDRANSSNPNWPVDPPPPYLPGQGNQPSSSSLLASSSSSAATTGGSDKAGSRMQTVELFYPPVAPSHPSGTICDQGSVASEVADARKGVPAAVSAVAEENRAILRSFEEVSNGRVSLSGRSAFGGAITTDPSSTSRAATATGRRPRSHQQPLQHFMGPGDADQSARVGPNGYAKYLSVHNGSGAVFYRSGRIALCFSLTQHGTYAWAYADREDSLLLASISPLSGCLCHDLESREITVVTTPEGGALYDGSGNLEKHFSWSQPVSIIRRLNSHITLRVQGKTDISLIFKEPEAMTVNAPGNDGATGVEGDDTGDAVNHGSNHNHSHRQNHTLAPSSNSGSRPASGVAPRRNSGNLGKSAPVNQALLGLLAEKAIARANSTLRGAHSAPLSIKRSAGIPQSPPPSPGTPHMLQDGSLQSSLPSQCYTRTAEGLMIMSEDGVTGVLSGGKITFSRRAAHGRSGVGDGSSVSHQSPAISTPHLLASGRSKGKHTFSVVPTTMGRGDEVLTNDHVGEDNVRDGPARNQTNSTSCAGSICDMNKGMENGEVPFAKVSQAFIIKTSFKVPRLFAVRSAPIQTSATLEGLRLKSRVILSHLETAVNAALAPNDRDGRAKAVITSLQKKKKSLKSMKPAKKGGERAAISIAALPQSVATTQSRPELVPFHYTASPRQGSSVAAGRDSSTASDVSPSRVSSASRSMAAGRMNRRGPSVSSHRALSSISSQGSIDATNRESANQGLSLSWTSGLDGALELSSSPLHQGSNPATSRLGSARTGASLARPSATPPGHKRPKTAGPVLQSSRRRRKPPCPSNTASDPSRPCFCSKTSVPELPDAIFDQYLSLSNSSLVIVAVVATAHSQSQQLLTNLTRLYRDSVRQFKFPCLAGGKFKTFKYTIDSRGGSKLLQKRHNLKPGVLLVFKGPHLVFLHRTFHGKAFSPAILEKAIAHWEKLASQGRFLPGNFNAASV